MKRLALAVGLAFCVGVFAPTPEEALASLVDLYHSKSDQLADIRSVINDFSDLTPGQKTAAWQLIKDKSALEMQINYLLDAHQELQAPELD